MGTREVPDAIGFKGLARKPMFSVLVECKTTRQDFLKDKEKASRRKSPDGPSPGMGSWRYYLAPKGMIDPGELREGWGLLELSGDRIYITVEATYQVQPEASVREELRLLVGAMSRVQCRENGWTFDEDTRHAAHNLGRKSR